MPIQILQAVLDNNCGDDRAPAITDPLSAAKPPVLARRTIYLLAFACVTAIGYVTLFPFEFDGQRTFTWELTWCPPAADDALANILVYVPLGAFLRLLFRRRGSWRLLEWISSITVAAGVSYGTEILQTVIPARVPSWADTICNFSGAFIGIAFAPAVQRGLRNLHGWVYQILRRRPLEAAAQVALLCVAGHALMPFDFQPTPGHLQRSWSVLKTSLAGLPVEQSYIALHPQAVLDKGIKAAAYALPAVLLVLAGLEAGRSRPTAAWQAFWKTCLLAAAIETLQFFTISHVAEPRDLLAAWFFCAAGAGAACAWLQLAPNLPQQPAKVLRGLVVFTAGIGVFWTAANLSLHGPGRLATPISWLPLANNFHRSWNGLLGDYTVGFLQYSLVAGLLTLWYRSLRRRPAPWLVLAATIIIAWLTLCVHAVFRGEAPDTAKLLLALLAAMMILRLDRTVFGQRKPLPSSAQPG